MMPKSPIGHPFASTGTGVRGLAVAAGPKPRDCLTRSTNTSVRAQSLIGSRPPPQGTFAAHVGVHGVPRDGGGAAPSATSRGEIEGQRCANPRQKVPLQDHLGLRKIASLRQRRVLLPPPAARQGGKSPPLCRSALAEKSFPPISTPGAWSSPSPVDRNIFFDFDSGVREENSGRCIGFANSQR